MNIERRKILNGSNMVKLLLLVSGLVAVGIAATILLAPAVFYAGYGIEVAGDANLVNELKAPAGALLALLRARKYSTHQVLTRRLQ